MLLRQAQGQGGPNPIRGRGPPCPIACTVPDFQPETACCCFGMDWTDDQEENSWPCSVTWGALKVLACPDRIG